MDIFYIIYFAILGLVFGSFYNVVGLRVPKGESIVRPPSHCTSCDKRLTALELIPVLSFMMQRGKCRGCGVKLSPIYMVTEIITAALFAVSFWHFGFQPELAVALLFISLLVIINVSDIAYMLIPDKILLFFLPLLIIARLFAPLDVWWYSLAGAVAGFVILYAIAIVSKGGMGGGDIKLFFLIGYVLGPLQTLLTLCVASMIGLVVGLIFLRLSKQGRKTPIPFGPSIAASAVLVYFYGQRMIEWYVNLF